MRNRIADILFCLAAGAGIMLFVYTLYYVIRDGNIGLTMLVITVGLAIAAGACREDTA